MSSSAPAAIVDMRSLLDPQWRYHASIRLADDGVVVFQPDVDNHVVRLTTFLTEWRVSTPEQQEALQRVDHDMYWAYEIYSREYRGPRFHIDALVVADMPTEEIATYLSLPVGVIETYELCFFDIRRHLNKPGAVRTYIGSRIRDRGNRDLDPDAFWKQVALSSGADALMALWSDGEMEPAILNRIDGIVGAQVRRRALQAIHVRDVNTHNAHEVMEEYLDMRRAEAERERVAAETGGVQQGVASEFVAALLASIQLSAGSGAVANSVRVDASVQAELVNRLQSVSRKELDDATDSEE